MNCRKTLWRGGGAPHATPCGSPLSRVVGAPRNSVATERGHKHVGRCKRRKRQEISGHSYFPLGVCEGVKGEWVGAWRAGRTRTPMAESEGERGRVAPCRGEDGGGGCKPLPPHGRGCPRGTGRALGEPRTPRRDSGRQGASRNGAGRGSKPQRGKATRWGGGDAKRRGSPTPPHSPPSKASGERGGGDSSA